MPSETRYMRYDTQTVNGLTAYVLGTSQTTLYRVVSYSQSAYFESGDFGFRVWKRDVNGVETEITDGSPVVVATLLLGDVGLYDKAWNCPQVSLNPTDAIVVRVYARPYGGSWNLLATFITVQLGTTILNSATWTVYLYCQYEAYEDPYTGQISYRLRFWWGTTTYNSRIENFTLGVVAPVGVPRFIGDGLAGAVMIV
jgi:hypothetical protein